MKNSIILPLVIIYLAIFLQSCSIEKRAYMKGYRLEKDEKKKIAERSPMLLVELKPEINMINEEKVTDPDNSAEEDLTIE